MSASSRDRLEILARFYGQFQNHNGVKHADPIFKNVVMIEVQVVVVIGVRPLVGKPSQRGWLGVINALTERERVHPVEERFNQPISLCEL